MDFYMNPNVSLREKLARHYKDRMENPGLPSAGTLNNLAPAFFFIVFAGAVAWGTLVVIPFYYTGWKYVVYEMFTIYVTIQILVNWLYLHHSDNTYYPEKHGTKDEVENQMETEQDRDGQNGVESEVQGEEASSSAESKARDATTHKVYIVTSVSSTKIERKAVNYWSWTNCIVCKRLRPPRCHHCTLCKRCVLKRDHHCFFARNCVGLMSQRFFIYFILWCVVITLWGTYVITPYVFLEILRDYSYWDFVFPINVVRWVLGYFPLLYLHLSFVSFGTILLLILSSSMSVINVYLTVRGITSFENDESIKITDTRDLWGRLRATFGEWWGLSIIIPGYTKTKPVEDAVTWPYIKTS